MLTAWQLFELVHYTVDCVGIETLSSGYCTKKGVTAFAVTPQILGRGEKIRTFGLLLPKQARYQAALRPDECFF
jgi:hypothetical protein